MKKQVQCPNCGYYQIIKPKKMLGLGFIIYSAVTAIPALFFLILFKMKFMLYVAAIALTLGIYFYKKNSGYLCANCGFKFDNVSAKKLNKLKEG